MAAACLLWIAALDIAAGAAHGKALALERGRCALGSPVGAGQAC